MTGRRRGGQVSVDFLAVWAGMLLIFLVLFGLYFEKGRDWAELRLRDGAKEVAGDFARNANFVHLAGPGASARIWLLPSLSASANYTLRVVGRRAEINWTAYSETVAAPLIFSGFNGSSGGEIVLISPGRWTNITNNGGIVYVSQD